MTWKLASRVFDIPRADVVPKRSKNGYVTLVQLSILRSISFTAKRSSTTSSIVPCKRVLDMRVTIPTNERTSLLPREQHQDEPSNPLPLKKVSRFDLTWILVGLWSAVFLSALDGACQTFIVTACSPHCRF